MPVESDERQREQANGELLQAFISAKKIEGCSNKTLYYYQSSIEALLSSEQKRIDALETMIFVRILLAIKRNEDQVE